MEAILIVTDLAKPASNAVQYAAQLGAQLRANYMVLYHAYKFSSVSGGTSEYRLSLEKMQDSKEELLSGL